LLVEDATSQRLHCNFCEKTHKGEIIEMVDKTSKNPPTLLPLTEHSKEIGLPEKKTFFWFIISSCDPPVKSVKEMCERKKPPQCRLNWIKTTQETEKFFEKEEIFHANILIRFDDGLLW
jgi:hypothetical protein